MARTRLIKPEFFKHGELYDAERATGLPLRIAFAGLWCQADREGRFVWKPRELKLDVLPYDDVDFAAVLDALAGAGFVVRYEAEGRAFGHIPSFAKHQTFNGREQPSRIPAPDSHGASTGHVQDKDSTCTGQAPDSHPTNIPSTGTGTGTDKQIPGASAPDALAVDAERVASPRRARRAAEPTDAPKGGYDRLPKAVCDAAWEAWVATIGNVDYGRFRRELLPAFQSAGPHPTADELVNSIAAFDEARSGDRPQFQAKYTVALWAAQLATYVRLGGMPLVDEWGNITERGVAAGLAEAHR